MHHHDGVSIPDKMVIWDEQKFIFHIFFHLTVVIAGNMFESLDKIKINEYKNALLKFTYNPHQKNLCAISEKQCECFKIH